MRAVRDYARAVRRVVDLMDIPSPDPQTEYHAKEYLPEMETLLLHQLLTATLSEETRLEILSAAGLDYLSDRLSALALKWDSEE